MLLVGGAVLTWFVPTTSPFDQSKVPDELYAFIPVLVIIILFVGGAVLTPFSSELLIVFVHITVLAASRCLSLQLITCVVVLIVSVAYAISPCGSTANICFESVFVVSVNSFVHWMTPALLYFTTKVLSKLLVGGAVLTPLFPQIITLPAISVTICDGIVKFPPEVYFVF